MTCTQHLALVGVLFCFGCAGARPANLGVKDGKLPSCPASPNCVSSQSPDPAHAVEPLHYSVPPPQAMADLKQILAGMKRSQIITETDPYIHVEFTSLIFRFVDDVEFYQDTKNRVIQVRSASRLGYSDLGVNRRRVETIREKWRALQGEGGGK